MTRGSGTLAEVARQCEVSESTVSRVLNNARPGRFSVSADVRRRVLRVAQELNYRPSMAARNLTAGKTKLVAVMGIAGIWSDRVGPVEEAVGAMAESLDNAGYDIYVSFMSKRHGPFDLPALRVDGVVAVGPKNVDTLKALDDSGLPYVSINGLTGERGSAISPDDAKGTRLALKHLHDLGHRKIAYLDHWSIDATHPSVTERRTAYLQSATELGFIAPELKLPMLPADTAWDSFYEPFVRRAIVEEKATAVLAYSHQGALALLRTAHDLGLSVPRDFSLICFNNEPSVRLSVPSITAVDVPSARMGQMAAEVLLQQMSAVEPMQPVRLKLEESLVVRESTTPPAAQQ
jgi:LacI family transcriptional regulator